MLDKRSLSPDPWHWNDKESDTLRRHPRRTRECGRSPIWGGNRVLPWVRQSAQRSQNFWQFAVRGSTSWKWQTETEARQAALLPAVWVGPSCRFVKIQAPGWESEWRHKMWCLLTLTDTLCLCSNQLAILRLRSKMTDDCSANNATLLCSHFPSNVLLNNLMPVRQ